MKQENDNVTIFMGGGYEIAYIGKDISLDVAEAVKQLINENGEQS